MSTDHRSEVEDTALALLHDKSRTAFGDVSCEYEEGTIILRGQSASYYDKQTAQETVRRIDGVTHIVNEIEVRPSSISTSTKSAPSHPIQVGLRSLEVGTPDFEFVLTGSRVLIGRADAVDIRIESRCVSRYHCEIGSINGTLWVRDLGSANGVVVNGLRETQAHLMPGDRLTIGESGFRVEYDQHPSKCYEDVLP
jgi:hypothetical protein